MVHAKSSTHEASRCSQDRCTISNAVFLNGHILRLLYFNNKPEIKLNASKQHYWIDAVKHVIQCHFNHPMHPGPLTPAFYHNISFDSHEPRRWCTNHHSVCNTWRFHLSEHKHEKYSLLAGAFQESTNLTKQRCVVTRGKHQNAMISKYQNKHQRERKTRIWKFL